MLKSETMWRQAIILVLFLLLIQEALLQASVQRFCMLDRDGAQIESRPAVGMPCVGCQLPRYTACSGVAAIEPLLHCLLAASRLEHVVVITDVRPTWVDHLAAASVQWAPGTALEPARAMCARAVAGRAVLVFGPTETPLALSTAGMAPLNMEEWVMRWCSPSIVVTLQQGPTVLVHTVQHEDNEDPLHLVSPSPILHQPSIWVR